MCWFCETDILYQRSKVVFTVSYFSCNHIILSIFNIWPEGKWASLKSLRNLKKKDGSLWCRLYWSLQEMMEKH